MQEDNPYNAWWGYNCIGTFYYGVQICDFCDTCILNIIVDAYN